MSPPQEFVHRLSREFGGRLRIRWSPRREEWHIEQKVGRALGDPPRHIPDWHDQWVRARDGYHFLCAIRTGDRMPCPICRQSIPVPIMRMGEAMCQACKDAKRTARGWYVSFWPLGDGLIEQLRKMDPLRTWHEEVPRELRDADARRDAQQARNLHNAIEPATKDAFTQLFEIQSVGYTGKEHAWQPPQAP